MPFDLPPPLPPQLAETPVLEQRYESAEKDDRLILKVGGQRLLISGNTYLSPERIRAVTAPANTPSQAIRLLNALYRAEGYLFVTVAYAPDKQSTDIYVHVYEGQLVKVKGPDFIEPFFEPFKNEPVVTESDTKPNRILAGIQARRVGYNLFSRFALVDGKPGAYKLIFEGREDPDHQPVEFTATFGNPGNRFLGRYFGFANVTFYTPSGAKVDLSYGTAFTQLGDEQRGSEYSRYGFGYSTVTPFGLYQLRASYTSYKASNILSDIRGADIKDREQAEIIKAGIYGTQFLYADADTRLLIKEALKYVESTIKITKGAITVQTNNGGDTQNGLLGGLLGGLLDGLLDPVLGGGNAQTRTIDLSGTTLQDETYGVARLGLSLSQSWLLFGRKGKLLVSTGYKMGFAGEINNNLVDPTRTANFGIIEAAFSTSYTLPANLLATLKLKGQLSTDDRLPQQQQWVLGGPNNLSAFLPGILVGDTGAYGRFQITLPRWHLFSRPVRLSIYAEAGSASFEGPNPPGGRTERRTASDAGIKLQFSPVDHITVTGYIAEPISTSNISEARLESAEADFYFSVKAEF